MVKFCVNCGSVYNHIVGDDGKFYYKCLICGTVDKVIDHCIVVNNLDKKATDYQLNKNMIYDHTLPRTRQIKCPTCQTKENPELIIFQYNPEMLNVGYMCTSCLNYWKNVSTI